MSQSDPNPNPIGDSGINPANVTDTNPASVPGTNPANVPGTYIYGMSTVPSIEPGLLPPIADKTKHQAERRISDVITGVQRINQSSFNKNLAFSLRERQLLRINGLLPARVMNLEEQVTTAVHYLRDYECDIDRFIYLMHLQDTVEKIFYKVVQENIEETLPVLYHPTIGAAIKQFGLVYSKPRGLFITVNDLGHVPDILINWPNKNIKVVILTDGEKVQGIGDIGVFSHGVAVSKAALYTALGGVNPSQILPITIDVGTDNQELLDDKKYVGLRQNRVVDDRYDRLVQEVFESVVEKYGKSTVVQFESLGNANSFRLLDQYRAKYTSFNDNIQGTAASVVAALLATFRHKDLNMPDQTFLFYGAGEATIGIANLLTVALVEMHGLDDETAKQKIWLMDSKGVIIKNRPAGGLSVNKVRWAKADYKPLHELPDAIVELKPTVLIGLSGRPGDFGPEVFKLMSKNTDCPIIFSLSNPMNRAEATAEETYKALKGRVVYAGGCTYAPYEMTHKTIHTSQISSIYTSPGIVMAQTACNISTITEGMFLAAAQVLASFVTDTHFEQGRVLPPIEQLHELNTKIAVHLVEYAYKNKLANYYPEPRDKNYFVKSQQYRTNYTPVLPCEYDWPVDQQLLQ